MKKHAYILANGYGEKLLKIIGSNVELCKSAELKKGVG
jgi:hypothetical protein